ncbi:PDR/VanB family oxidoreductase [Caballeronia novacaledonica]|uniref:Oxidoreductase n=1 Tax=Caballeronia novacaledonica TaxID=1544861 RepID=A0AA37IGH8_9BURK|nr:PDR/VanB family oxidoreductase [Caballeronia novacaledonica]GJH29391.1 oxidoreductase [Caballeronia novacaledonica]
MLIVKVKTKREVAEDICAFELVNAEGNDLPPFTAGSHVDVHIPGSVIRQYSLCNSPVETGRYVIGVLKDPASRGGSEAMHRLEEGTLLKISEPRNHFPLTDGAGHSILLAGGIGITPLLSMAERMLQTGDSFELHYCARSRSKLAFFDQLTDAHIRSNVIFHLDSEPETALDAATVLSRETDRAPHVYVCGPGGFIDYILGAARQAKYPEAQLHREYFASVATPGGEEQSFDIQVASTGLVIQVSATESIVAALERHEIDVPVSCEQGVCGTCLTRVKGGIPLHRDMFLTDEERLANDRFTPCCSRSLTPLLVLDL